MGFEQAAIKVEREPEFAELQGAISRIFSGNTEKFLKSLQSNGVRVRDLDAVLGKNLLERADEALAKSGRTAKALYGALTPSDQGQIREFYLRQLEEVPSALRTKYQKIYRYY